MIIGGSKYKAELAKLRSYLPIIVELDKRRKVVKIADEEVDRVAASLKAKKPEAAFNDEHIVALVITSRCTVVCTNDKEAIPYLKLTAFYKKPIKKPKIYSLRTHAKLCNGKHVVSACKVN